MRTTIHIVALLISGFGFAAQAQTTAVMQARVEIISGASLTSVNETIVDLSTLNVDESSDIQAGAFSLVAAPGTDFNVSLTNENSLKNEYGEIINFDSLSFYKTSNEKGEHHISVNGSVKTTESIKGIYNGRITAVVEYL